MKRIASAHWQGSFKQGQGTISTETNVLKDTPYSFTSRFESGKGTNPEELIAAAHAGCFTMALSAFLEKEGFTATSLDTTATTTIEQVNGAWTVTMIYLELKAQIKDIDKAKFEAIALSAKENCPISRLLNAKITLDWNLN